MADRVVFPQFKEPKKPKRKPVARRKGDPGKADQLFRDLVRSRGVCERCGDRFGPYDTAHIIGRARSGTRCELDNAWCLCRPCHKRVDEWWDEKWALVKETIGIERYWQLKAKAEGHASIRQSSATFWRNEVARLTALTERTA